MCVLLYSSFLWGALWEAAFDGVPFFPSGLWNAEDRIVLGNTSRPFGLSSYVLEHFPPLGAGLGPSTKWAEVAKFFGPTLLFKGFLLFEILNFNAQNTLKFTNL